MGKTPKPLTIFVAPELAEWPEIKALHEQGHVVTVLGIPEGDVYLGPRCWRMGEPERKWLDLAIDEARKRRYAK